VFNAGLNKQTLFFLKEKKKKRVKQSRFLTSSIKERKTQRCKVTMGPENITLSIADTNKHDHFRVSIN
jgi:hypothetical protein